MPNKKYYSSNNYYSHHSHRETPVNALLSPGEGAVNLFVQHRLQHRQLTGVSFFLLDTLPALRD